MSRHNSVGDVSHELVIYGLAALAILVLLGPVVVVLITSFTDNQSLKFPPQGFSLQWYEKLFDPSESRQIHRAAFNTLEVACWAAGAAALLGTCAAIGIVLSVARNVEQLEGKEPILPAPAINTAN